MIKQLQLRDRSVRPFQVYKDHNINLYSNETIILTEELEPIHATYESSSNNVEITSSLALEFQRDLNKIQISKGEKSPTNLFYDTSSVNYNATFNPLDWTGQYKRSIYDVIKNSFYNDNISENLGTETLGINANGKYIENRNLENQIIVGKIPQTTFGEKIIPGTFFATDYSNPLVNISMVDDGNTNLISKNYYQLGNKLSQPTHRIDGIYEVDNDRFGYSIDANGGYLIIGSPMFSSSFGNSKPGAAYLFKHDSSNKRYRFVKEFISPKSQISMERELGDDFLIDTEQGGFVSSISGSHSDLSVIDEFGYSVAVSDEFLVVGSPTSIINSTSSFKPSGSGMVFVYDKAKGGIDNWGLINVFSGSSSTDRFGSSVSVDDDRMVVGAEGKNLAYVYTKKTYMSSDECESIETSSGDPYFVSGNAVWILDNVLYPLDSLSGFGGTVSIDGDIIAVGSKKIQSTPKVFLYEFQQSGSNCITGSWNGICTIIPTNLFSKEYIGNITKNTSSAFGHSISINDNIIAIGDPFASTYQLYSDIQTVLSESYSTGTLNIIVDDDASIDNTSDWTPHSEEVLGGPATLTFNTDHYQLELPAGMFGFGDTAGYMYHNSAEFTSSLVYNYSIDARSDSSGTPIVKIVGYSSSNDVPLIGTEFETFDVDSSWKTYTGSFNTNYLTTEPDYFKVGLGIDDAGDIDGFSFFFKNILIWTGSDGGVTSSFSESVELNPPKNVGATYIYKLGIAGSECCFFCEELPTSSISCNWGPLQILEGDTDRENFFGYSVDISGPNLIVGSPFDIHLSSSYNSEFLFEKKYYAGNEGVGKIFTIDPLETFYLESGEIYNKTQIGREYQSFGHAVSLNNNYAFIGGPCLYYNSPLQNEFTSSLFMEENVDSSLQGNVYTYRIGEIGESAHLGNIFYKNGLIVITNTASQFENVFNDAYEISFQSQHTIYEEEYIITVNPGEFNVSQNPTAVIKPDMAFDINGNGTFDFEDVDLILRYINKYKIYVTTQMDDIPSKNDDGYTLEQDLFNLKTSLTTKELISRSIKSFVSDESWWNNDILMVESEDVLISEIPENVEVFFTDSKLSEQYIEKLRDLESSGYLDINGDGNVDAYDANIILKYYNKSRTQNLINGNITDTSSRTTVSDIILLLDEYTGTNRNHIIHPNFYNYMESSSYDKTGSYLSPYVTTIGLYDDNYNLVGLAKLGSPIKILQDYPINFIVSWDK